METLTHMSWPADTTVTLCNVPWDSEYRDVVKFGSAALRDSYLDANAIDSIRITNNTYIRQNEPVMVEMPFSEAWRYNYLRVQNSAQPIAGDVATSFYYFIIEATHVSPSVTQLTVQLDVFQTYIYGVEFGSCFVERGHIGIANERSFDNFGRDYLTVPEGLDIGGDYRIWMTAKERLMRLRDNVGVADQVNVLVASAVDLTADAGSVEPGSGGPKIVMADGSNLGGLPSGASLYAFRSIDLFRDFLRLRRDQSWVTSAILGIWVIPDIRRYIPGFSFDALPNTGGASNVPSGNINPIMHNMQPNWRQGGTGFGSDVVPARYRGLKKLFTSPYMIIEMTTFGATPIIIKPELWNNDDATVVERIALNPPNQRIMFNPYKYNALNQNQAETLRPGLPAHVEGGDDGGEWLDMATFISNFPTLAILNDAAIGFLASNFNQLAFAPRAADYSQQVALMGNQLSYDQATKAMETTAALSGISQNFDRATTAQAVSAMQSSQLLNSITGIVGGGVGGASGGAPAGPVGIGVGAVSGLGSGLMGAATSGFQNNLAFDNMNANLALRQGMASESLSASQSQAGYNRDTNKALADYTARGSYEQQMAALQAKTQDAQLVQPSTSGQMGGEVMNILNDSMMISLRWKIIDRAALHNIGEFWLRYGYRVMRRVQTLPASLRVMTKFTYWKLTETYLVSGAMPEMYKNSIRGIFEKGVTVYANPSDIGTVDPGTNNPIAGVRL